ncbi:hypothetical protein OROHE_004004 [Orobanche hederae]
MAFSEKQYYVESETDSQYSDDSEEDPNFDVAEEARLTFSNLSLKKKSKTRVVVKGTDGKEDERSDVIEMVMPELDEEEEDQKSYETIQKIIEGGQVERLKIEQCKIYLRKHGLRLSGNKETLTLRIKEHIDIVNGGGEKKYPASSFVLNCKGDACMGDIVVFEQNVYEMFSIASRSANGPPSGTRFIAGRIVNESYGAAKQQHTFTMTIEVLWSKGEKPLPPLHPLLIKGRNLYRLKTMRQKWEDEGERQKMLSEKHARGGAARLNREARIKQRETRKAHKPTRARRAEHPTGKQGEVAKTQPLYSVPINPNKFSNPPKQHDLMNTKEEQNSEHKTLAYTTTFRPQNPNIIPNAQILPETIHQRHPLNSINCNFGRGQHMTSLPINNLSSSNSLIWWDGWNYTNYLNLRSTSPLPTHHHHHHPGYYHANPNHVKSPTRGVPFKENQGCNSVRPLRGFGHEGKQSCRYYAQGRCRFGDKCKFLHELPSNK